MQMGWGEDKMIKGVQKFENDRHMLNTDSDEGGEVGSDVDVFLGIGALTIGHKKLKLISKGPLLDAKLNVYAMILVILHSPLILKFVYLKLYLFLARATSLYKSLFCPSVRLSFVVRPSVVRVCVYKFFLGF